MNDLGYFMTTGMIFYVLFALFVKHLVIDFPIYTSYACRIHSEQRTPLWWLHIILHGVATAFLLWIITIPAWIAVLAGILDSVVHVSIDFIFYLLNKRFNVNLSMWWIPDTDQYFHCLFYVMLTFGLVMLV